VEGPEGILRELEVGLGLGVPDLALVVGEVLPGEAEDLVERVADKGQHGRVRV
jgi:hypothetical protein